MSFKLLYRHVFLFAVLFLGSTAIHAQQKHHQSSDIEDLLYKNTLFHYYSGDYISALTRILVNEKRSFINKDSGKTHILQGGIYLAYGLDYDAKQIFENLNTELLDEELRNVIWFYLGKDFYDNFDYKNAAGSLEKITKDKSSLGKQEKLNILSNSYVYTNDVAKLEALYQSGDFDTDDELYIKFNLAMAYLRTFQLAKGNKLLNELASLKIKNIVQSSIADKARLHLANIAFKDKAYKDTIKYVNDMNANGMYSDNAIYLSALSHSILGNTKKAYTLLNTLKARESRNIYKYYSVLLIARILEQNGQFREALKILNDGLHSISISKTELNNLLKKIRKDFFLTDLGKTKDGEIVITNTDYKKLVDELVFSKEFSTHYNNYIDLLNLRRTINYWKAQIPQLSLMLKERDRYFKEKRSSVSTKKFKQQQAQLSRKFNRLMNFRSQIQGQRDAKQLYSETEFEYDDDLEYLSKKVKRLSAYEDLSDLNYKIRIMQGLNYWGAATDYDPRLWDVKTALKESGVELKTLRNRINSLDITSKSEFNYQKYSQNIKAMSMRIRQLNLLLDNAIDRVKEQLVLIASNELDRRFKNIDAYYKAFKFDIARVSDRILITKEK